MHPVARLLPLLLWLTMGWTLSVTPQALAQMTFAQTPAPDTDFFPPPGLWPSQDATSLGIDPAAMQRAVSFAIAHESTAPKDQLIAQAVSFGAKEPFDQVIGPTNVRAGATGVVIYRGKVVAQWGEPDSIDMAHSITKTFLTTVTGIAWQQGKIPNLDQPVRFSLATDDPLFLSQHNQTITWQHLLRQTSDWQGSLWGKPDWADRPESKTPADWPHRPLRTPGTFFKYNDVRVNVLALATLKVLREPLPEVLNRQIMTPIGASNSWRWHGYDNSWLEIDGKRIQSVSGGGHWGGGLFINSWDLARFGYLVLHDGRWQNQQLLSKDWIKMASQGGPANPQYGFANWFLNTDQKALPAAPASAVYFEGNGRNIVYIDKQHDLVVVARWVAPGDSLNSLIGLLLAALPKVSPQ